MNLTLNFEKCFKIFFSNFKENFILRPILMRKSGQILNSLSRNFFFKNYKSSLICSFACDNQAKMTFKNEVNNFFDIFNSFAKFSFNTRQKNPNEKYSQNTMNKLKKDAKEFAGKLILNEDPKKPAVSSKNVFPKGRLYLNEIF